MESEQALRDALAFAESIVDTVRDPLLVLDAGLRVVGASREFYRTFRVTPKETVGRLVYDLGNGQWDIPRLRTLLEEILPKESTFRDFEVEHRFDHIGRKVMLLNARKVYRAAEGTEQILLAIEDATGRRDAEEARREAETRFTEMVKNVRDHSIFLTDPNGVVTSWNVAAERIIGYPESEAVGQHFSLIFTPEDVAAGLPEQELRTAREWGMAEDERWHRRKGGERFWALGIVTPLRDADGKLTGYSKILRDMTERKRADEVLRLTEERYRFLFNVMDQGVQLGELVRDERGAAVDVRILRVNPAWEHHVGVPADRVVGRRLSEWLPNVDRFWFELWERVIRTGRPERCERLSIEVGRWFDVFVSPVGGDRFMALFTDTTARKKQEQALRDSEERFRLMVHTVQDYAIFLMDPEGKVASWNEGAERILGYTADDVLGRPAAMFFTEEDRRAGMPSRELETAARTGRAADENWLVSKQGARFWASGTTTALRDGPAGLRGFAKILRDLTERRRTEQKVRESEERLRVALSAGGAGTWLWRIPEDEQILDDSLRRLMGLPAGEEALRFEQFLAAVHADDRDRVRGEIEHCLAAGGDVDFEFRVTWPDGSVRWLKDQGKLFRSADGRPDFMAGAAVDITEHKRMEEELREADRRKDEFLAMLAHELRNPLAPLRAVVDVLRQKRLEAPAQDRAYNMMDRQVTHLSRLVDDLLDVWRITRGLVELRHESVDLAEVVHQAAEMAGPPIELREHTLSVTLPAKPIIVTGDATRLTQVVYNLLNNAAKYTNPGGRIWLTLEREGDRAVVRVRDNGSGMNADLLPRVFDLFAQGERTADRTQGGLGLGLTLVKRLTEMHGGSVEVHSDGPGKGSEFVLRLPISPHTEAQAFRRENRPSVGARVGRALVVDDNPDVAESLTMLLEGLAGEIRSVTSGEAALELVRQWRPDLILCDVGMPDMDGYETCRRLRQAPGLSDVFIAAVSGYGTDDARRRSQAAGFDRHMVKPVSRATLQEAVAGVGKG